MFNATPVPPGGVKLITLLIAISLLAWLVRGVHILRMALASRDWTLVEGMCLDAHMEEHHGRDRHGHDDPSQDIFVPVVRYSYEVGRKKFESARLWYRTDALGDYSEALQTIRNISRGKPLDVYYDPGEPSRSVLITGFEVSNVATVAISGIAFVIYMVWWI